MKTKNIENMYLDHQRDIENLCKKMVKITNIDYYDILSEANIVFMKCCEKYNKQKGSFIKLFVTAFYFKMFRIMKQNKRRDDYIDYIEDVDPFNTKLYIKDNTDSIVNATFENLSRDGYDAFEVILDIRENNLKNWSKNENWFRSTKRRKIIQKKEIYNKLVSLGWKRKRILSVFHEFESVVNV